MIFVTLSITPVLADEGGRPAYEYAEPNGRDEKIDGEEMVCFSKEEYKTLGRIIIDYHWLWTEVRALEIDLKLSAKEIALREQRAEHWQQTAERIKANRDFMSKLFDAEHGYRLRLEKQSRSKEWVLWTVLVLESVAIAAIGVVQVANTN